MDVEIRKIKVPERPIDFQLVQNLADSIKRFGLITPIRIDMKFNLLSGLHRLEACKKLDRQTIRAEMFNQNESMAELVRLEETLTRRHFHTVELEALEAKRYALMKKAFPKKGRKTAVSEPVESKNQKNTVISEGISPYIRGKLEGLKLEREELIDLAQLDEDQQIERIEEIKKPA